MRYPVYMPEITEKEKEYVNECLDSTWISSKGKFIERFENNIAGYVGSKYATSVMNGTAALHLAMLCTGIKPGDSVIVPDFTYIATSNAVKYIGAKPVLADVDPETWNIGINEIEDVYNPAVKAIILVDMYGTPVDYDPIIEFADEKGLILIEDSAESLGAKYKDRMAGNIVDVGIFSFFGNKTITTGEGGMLVTDNDKFIDSARLIKNQGNSDSIRYFHDVLGYNFRMTNIQAAIGCAQFERIESILDKKRKLFDSYKKHLNNKIIKYQKIHEYISSSYWMVSILVENQALRDGLMAHLESIGIETRPFFVPISKMPYYENMNNAISYDLSGRGLNVPSYPMLNDDDIKFISENINEYLEENS